MKRTTIFLTAILLALSILCVNQQARAASITPLGDLPGGSVFSYATGVSNDGSVVVGRGYSGRYEGFRWTEAGGMVSMSDLAGGAETRAHGVSRDGAVVVGQVDTFSGWEAYHWSTTGGMVGLGDLPGGAFYSAAHAVSADGSVVVGMSDSASTTYDYEAFRWTEADGMVGLGDLPGGHFTSDALDVSADGNVVVGYSRCASGIEAFRWTEASGMVGIGFLPSGDSFSEANAVSADGTIIVGQGLSASGYEAYRWVEAEGMIGLGDLAGGNFQSEAYDVSADGATVVGWGKTDLGHEAFLWNDADGMRKLQDVLTDDYGVDLSDWAILSEAFAISDDGTKIVGYGVTDAFLGNTEAFLIDLSDGDEPGPGPGPAVPEPSTLALLLIGGVGLCAYGLRRKRKAALCAALLFACLFSFSTSTAHASSFSSVDDAVFGPDSVTYDPISGLEWLDWTLSTNWSANEIAGEFDAGGEFEGWRHATYHEVFALFTNYGLKHINDSVTNTDPTVDGLVDLLGATVSGVVGIHTTAITATPISQASSQHWFGRLYVENYSYLTGTAETNGYMSNTYSSAYVGQALVRDALPAPTVPEPSTLALLLIGGAGLFAYTLRRKRRLVSCSAVLLVCVMLLPAGSAHASSLISGDSEFGPDTVTIDTATGLEWLDWTQYAGLSYNEVSSMLSAGQELDGWSYATTESIITFYTNGGIPDIGDYTEANVAPVFGLFDLLGRTNGQAAIAVTADKVEQGADIRWLTALRYYNDMAEVEIQDHTLFDWQSYPEIGHALFRESQMQPTVPEPSTLVLLLIGGVGLCAFGVRRKRKAVLCAALLFACLFSFSTSSVHASSLISGDSEFGPDTVTIDTTTGLEWLDWTVTTDISYNDMVLLLAPGQIYDGWRHATNEEVAELFSDYGLQHIDDYQPNTTPPVDGLIDLIGETLTSWVGTPGSLAFTATPFDYGYLFIGVLDQDGGLASPGYASTHLNVSDPASYGASMGNALVRLSQSTVPEPSTLALLLIGGVGLCAYGARRKSRGNKPAASKNERA